MAVRASWTSRKKQQRQHGRAGRGGIAGGDRFIDLGAVMLVDEELPDRQQHHRQPDQADDRAEIGEREIIGFADDRGDGKASHRSEIVARPQIVELGARGASFQSDAAQARHGADRRPFQGALDGVARHGPAALRHQRGHAHGGHGDDARADGEVKGD